VGLRIHLLLCKWCRRYRRQIAFLRAAAQQCDEHEHALPPKTLSTAARQRIKERLQAGEKSDRA
jgi:predicted anti-sigma-YlaC factor YlaD